jgi:hypothetical protein
MATKMRQLKKISIFGNRIIEDQAIKEQNTYSLNFLCALMKKLAFNNLTISFFYIRDKSGQVPTFNQSFFKQKKVTQAMEQEQPPSRNLGEGISRRDTLFDKPNFTADSFYEIETKFNTNINVNPNRKDSKEDQSYGLNDINN